jgi:hypothetical protein
MRIWPWQSRRTGAATRARVPALLKGPDLRPERPAHLAEPHSPARPAVPLLLLPRGESPRPRHLPGALDLSRWRRRIENRQAKSITDLAEQEGVTDAYVCRLLPLTCLAPDILEALLERGAAEGAEAG